MASLLWLILSDPRICQFAFHLFNLIARKGWLLKIPTFVKNPISNSFCLGKAVNFSSHKNSFCLKLFYCIINIARIKIHILSANWGDPAFVSGAGGRAAHTNTSRTPARSRRWNMAHQSRKHCASQWVRHKWPGVVVSGQLSCAWGHPGRQQDVVMVVMLMIQE